MLAQILGILALIAMVLSYQMKDRKVLLWFQLASNALFAVSYFLLDAKTGAVLSLVNVARCVVFANRDKKWGESRLWLYFFLAVALVGGILSWEGPRSILVIAATLLLTVALYSENMKFMRKIFLVCPLLYIVYNILSGSIGGIGNDVFCLISAAVAFWRFDLRPAQEEKSAAGKE